jgi:hypothetical protein
MLVLVLVLVRQHQHCMLQPEFAAAAGGQDVVLTGAHASADECGCPTVVCKIQALSDVTRWCVNIGVHMCQPDCRHEASGGPLCGMLLDRRASSAAAHQLVSAHLLSTLGFRVPRQVLRCNIHVLAHVLLAWASHFFKGI